MSDNEKQMHIKEGTFVYLLFLSFDNNQNFFMVFYQLVIFKR